MATISGNTAEILAALGIHAFGGAEESDVNEAKERFLELKRTKTWREAQSLAEQYLSPESRRAITASVIEAMRRSSRVHTDMESTARRLNQMFSKADGPFFTGTEKWHTDGDESYTIMRLSWVEFWNFPSHEDDILIDLGRAGQIVLTLLALCPQDFDDLFCRPHLECWREGANIFGEEPVSSPPYGSICSPALESWIGEVLQ